MVLQPKIIYHLAGIFAAAAAFFILIPGIGAFRIRSVWRLFRALLLESALLPSLRYTDIREIERRRGGAGVRFRFFGRLQALQGDNTIWLSDGEVSLPAELQQVYVYILDSNTPLSQDLWEHYPAKPPLRVKWDKISSLPEETKIFVSGEIMWKAGRASFVDTANNPLFVLIYEGNDSELLIRGTWSGRQKNEYWNALSPGSLLLGFFSLFIYFYILTQFPQFIFPAITALTLACIPITPLLPPAVITYYFYRRFWQRGRVLRAQRDLLRLPLSFFSEKEGGKTSQEITLHNGETYRMRVFPSGDLPRETPAYRVFPKLSASTDTRTCVFFGGGEGDALTRPLDPMAEAMIVPGDPFELAHKCQRSAFRNEILGLLILIFGIGITEFLLFVLFSYIVL